MLSQPRLHCVHLDKFGETGTCIQQSSSIEDRSLYSRGAPILGAITSGLSSLSVGIYYHRNVNAGVHKELNSYNFKIFRAFLVNWL